MAMGKGSRLRDARRQQEVSPAHLATRGRRSLPVLWGAIAVIVISAVAAVVISGGKDDGNSAKRWGEPYSTIEVDGPSLPAYPGADRADPAVGKDAPSVNGTSMAGRAMSVGDSGSELLVFVAHWCPHCQKEVPILARYLARNPAPSGVGIAAIATKTSSSRPNYPPQPWLDREGWKSPVLLDDQVATAGAAFGTQGYPYFVAIGPDGKVVRRASGEISTGEFQKLIDAAAAGKA